jgi:large subunit ribosomal protein L6
MSRIGKNPIKILPNVKLEVKNDVVYVEGPKGKLSHKLPIGISTKLKDGELLVQADNTKAPRVSAMHGLTRSLIQNMVLGVHTGFVKELDIVGVGYRASMKGNILSMTLGYSHPVEYALPVGISAKVENNTHIVVSGADKILVGMVAAKIRGFKEPEPYQGKGIKYTNEQIIRKQGKAAGAK